MKWFQLPQHIAVRIVMLVVVALLAFTLAFTPQSVALACGPVGGSCHCPGC
jgi:hypothetical protein